MTVSLDISLYVSNQYHNYTIILKQYAIILLDVELSATVNFNV